MRYPLVLRHDTEFLFLGISPLLSNDNKLLRHYAKLTTQTIARALGVFSPADAGCVPGPTSPNSARMDISLKFLDFCFQLSNFNFQCLNRQAQLGQPVK